MGESSGCASNQAGKLIHPASPLRSAQLTRRAFMRFRPSFRANLGSLLRTQRRAAVSDFDVRARAVYIITC